MKMASLKVTIGKDNKGTYTAYSLSSPYFCFSRNTKEELVGLVNRSLVDYETNSGEKFDALFEETNQPITYDEFRQILMTASL